MKKGKLSLALIAALLITSCAGTGNQQAKETLREAGRVSKEKGEYYEIFTTSSEYNGYMPDTTIGDFFNSLNCNTCEPYTILGGVNLDTPDSTNAVDSQQDYISKSNNSAVTGKNKAENIGVALFKDDKLVGELNAVETISFLNMRNQIKRFMVSVPDPENENKYLDIYLTPIGSVDIDVDTSTSVPYIKIDCRYSGQIYSMSENSNYLSSDVLDSISNSCNSYLESIFLDYLYKTSKDFQSDANGFGKYALKNFLTVSDYESYNWNENYKNAFFEVNIDSSIKSGMMITSSES